MGNVGIDLPDERSQLETRSLPRFGELRKHVYAQIQMARQAGLRRRSDLRPSDGGEAAILFMYHKRK